MGPERRLECRLDRRVVVAGRHVANVAQQGLDASRTCHQHALEVGAHIASFEPRGAGAQHRDRGRHRLAVLTGTDVAGRVGAPDDDHAEPVELVD